MNKSAPIVLVLLAAVACTNHDRQSTGSAAAAPKGSPAATAEQTPGAGGQRNARRLSPLWAQAPRNAVLGVVVADGFLRRVVTAANGVTKIVAAIPSGKTLLDRMHAGLMAEAPFDLLDVDAYAAHGIDIDKGAAFFADENGEAVGILPVGNREAFRTLVEGKVEKQGERTIDRMHHGVCSEKGDLYVCGDTLELVDSVGGGTEGDLYEKVASLSADLRGDVELVAMLDRIPDAKDDLSELDEVITHVGTGVLSLRLDRGTVSVRGWLEGTPSPRIGAGLKAMPAALELPATGTPIAVWRTRIPLTAAGVFDDVPAKMPIGAFDARASFVDQLTGDVALVVGTADAPPNVAVSLTLGMRDTKALANAMGMLCSMAAQSSGLQVQASTGHCSTDLDPSKLPDPTLRGIVPDTIHLDLATTANAVRLTLGSPAKGVPVADHAGAAATRSVLADPWNLSMWMRLGDPFAATPVSSLLAPLGLTGSGAEYVRLARVLMAHFYDLGMAGRLDERGAHVTMALTTMAADPEDAYAAYSTLVTSSIGKDETYATKLGALAATHPGTLLARQARSASTAQGLGFMSGMLAAIAVPAFHEYMERSTAQKVVSH